MHIEKIYIGSWFQRTMLHLSEVYDFLAKAESPLAGLDAAEMTRLRDKLDIEHLEMHTGYLDHIHAHAKYGVHFRVYEDGLITISKDPSDDLTIDLETLREYYEEKLSPAISYIFSLGAPVPKELANIKTVFPYFVVTRDADEAAVGELLNSMNQQQYFAIHKDRFQIYRGDTLYIINNASIEPEAIADFVQEQIFVREFKGQMHRYLNLHRIIWERIAEVKERGEIRGKDIKEFKNKIEGYSKTINLIAARINQMGAYVATRSKIVHANTRMEPFVSVLEFNHEKLEDTLGYVKEVWSMTRGYVDSALTLFGDLQAKATEKSIKSLTIITSLGVAATLMKFLGEDSIPVTTFGVFYLIGFVVIMYFAGKAFVVLNQSKTYEIKDVQEDRNIE